ncbi:MAG: DNRLRE domain-containing protein, partial [Cyclobacteriaceae bacterium]
MEVGDEGQSSYNAFKNAVKAQTLDLSELSSGTVRLNGRDGSYLKTTYNTTNDRPILYRNSEEVYEFLEDELNYSVYRSVTPPLADLTSAVVDGATVNFAVTASDPERGLISQDYDGGTMRIITNDYVFTSSVTLDGTVTYSEVAATAGNTQGALKAVEFYAGEIKVGEITDPGQLASGNMTFAWTDAINGTHEVRARAIDEEGNATWSNSHVVTVTGGTGLPETIAVNPSADTYAKDGNDANNNYGTSSFLETKLNAGARREAYLKFNLNEVSGPITDAKLRVYGRLINNNTPTVATGVFTATDTTWTETGLTYNNKPVSSTTALASVNISGVAWTWYEWDVADYLEAERAAGRQIVTLVLKNTVSSDPFNWYESRENNNKPEIVLTYTPSSGPAPSSNVALNKPTTTDSHHQSLIGALAVDGEISGNNSRWVSANTAWPHWIEVDLQGEYTIDAMNFWTGHNGYNRPVSYRFQRWDGNDWIDIVTDLSNSNAVVERAFTPVTTSKVRLFGVSGSDNHFRLYELEVYGTPASGARLAFNSLDELNENSETITPGIEVYPNPAREVLHLSGSTLKGSNVHIINSAGKMVFTKTLSSEMETIETASLTRGLYILQIVSEGKVQHRKFIKE